MMNKKTYEDDEKTNEENKSEVEEKSKGRTKEDYSHKWIVLLAHADWLARRWLPKYYSPTLRWIIINFSEMADMLGRIYA